MAFENDASSVGGVTIEDLRTGATTLIAAGFDVKLPAISPDGSRVVFSAYTTDPNVPDVDQLWTVPTDGSAAPTQLTFGLQDLSSGSWSPDGSEIAASFQDHQSVQIIDATTGEPTGAGYGGSSPSFSPDGTHLVVQNNDEIVSYDLSTGTATTLGPGVSPRWSPDGSSILYGTGYSPERLYTMDPNGSNVHELSGVTPDPEDSVGSWAWSSDGQTIVFTGYSINSSNQAGYADIYLTDPAGVSRSSTGVTPSVAEVDVTATGDTLANVPQPPGEVQATFVPSTDGSAPDQAAVSWSAPDAGGVPITGYVVTPYMASAQQKQLFVTASTDSVVVDGLETGSAYTFTVAAIDAGGQGSPSTATAPLIPRTPTAVSVTSATKKAIAGSPILVRGQLMADGRPAVGQRVYLQYRPRATSEVFRDGPVSTTDANGIVSFKTFAPTSSIQLRLWHPAQGGLAASTSTSAAVTETRKVTLTASRKSVRSGHRLTIAGVVAPSQGSGPVLVQERRGSSAWRTVGRATIGSRSRYTLNERVAGAGKETFRALVTADTDFAQSVSASEAIRITR